MSRNRFFDREGNEVTPEGWVNARQQEDVSVANDVIPHGPGSIEISTIWLGLEDGGIIKHYETMVYGGRLDGQTWVSSTKDDAILMHAHVKKLVLKNK